MIQEIKKTVYAKGKGNMEDKTRIGSIYYNRGVVFGIITVEAIRTAQAKFGKASSLTAEQIRWGIENLNITEARLKELGAVGFMQPLKVSCADHEGGGAVKFQQWDGKKWNVITDWIQPDREAGARDDRAIRGRATRRKRTSRRAIAARKADPPTGRAGSSRCVPAFNRLAESSAGCAGVRSGVPLDAGARAMSQTRLAPSQTNTNGLLPCLPPPLPHNPTAPRTWRSTTSRSSTTT